jgi:hypothetical protein
MNTSNKYNKQTAVSELTDQINKQAAVSAQQIKMNTANKYTKQTAVSELTDQM